MAVNHAISHPFRSLLFVPGSRPDRFEKAIASGTDSVCIDLEDAVATGDKDSATEAVQIFFQAPLNGAHVGVRINAIDDPQSQRDLAMLAETKVNPSFVMVPKVESDLEIVRTREALGANPPPLWSLAETPEAIVNANNIAKAVGPDGGIVFGGVDYSASIGSDLGWDALLFARGALVNAAAIGGCQLLDVPYLDVNDGDGMVAETRRVKSMGFPGRACIHPRQIDAVNEVFSPSQEEIDTAEKIVVAFEAAGGGVALLDGRLIEKPVLLAAQRTLSLKNC